MKESKISKMKSHGYIGISMNCPGGIFFEIKKRVDKSINAPYNYCNR